MTQLSPTSPKPPGALGRIADFSFVHRRRVLLGWLVVLVLAIAAAATFGGTYTADYSTPGSDSKAASDRLAQRFAGRSGDQVDLVWKASAGATAPAVKERIDRLLKQADAVEGIVPGTTASAAEVSPDGRTAVVRLPLDRPSSALPASSGEELRTLVESAQTQGQAGDGRLEVAANGSVAGLKQEAGMNAELVGIAVAALVLMLTFGTVVAAGLPLLSALFGVGVAATLGGVLAAVLDTPDWALQVSLMIGIGVGIDYALLILTRYRAAVDAGKDRRAANIEAMSTAGHSVLTAGATVVDLADGPVPDAAAVPLRRRALLQPRRARRAGRLDHAAAGADRPRRPPHRQHAARCASASRPPTPSARPARAGHGWCCAARRSRPSRRS